MVWLPSTAGRRAIALDKLRNNPHAILTVADGFLPQAGLKQATAHLYDRD